MSKYINNMEFALTNFKNWVLSWCTVTKSIYTKRRL